MKKKMVDVGLVEVRMLRDAAFVEQKMRSFGNAMLLLLVGNE